jgi:hypothetical protein
MAKRERSTTVEALMALAVAIPACIGVIMLARWGAGDWTETVNERVMTCTVTAEHEGAAEYLIHSMVITAECGELVTDYLATPPSRNGPADGIIEVGHTYRLRIGDVRPPLAHAYQRIIAIEGKL